jgi:hypothetical protein
MKATIGVSILFFLVLFQAGCTKNEINASSELTGVWFKNGDYAEEDQKRITEWDFKGNGRFEIVYAEFQKSTEDFLGFSVLYAGNYEVKDGVLHMSNMIGYSYDFDGSEFIENAAYFLERDSFFSNSGTPVRDNAASISFTDLNNKVVLTYLECNDTFTEANCVGEETLTRK